MDAGRSPVLKCVPGVMGSNRERVHAPKFVEVLPFPTSGDYLERVLHRVYEKVPTAPSTIAA
jgi:hypothetical protein